MSSVMERRICARPIEIREAADGTINLRGYAAVFNTVAYGEVVKGGAFNRTLAQRDDVRLLVNHDGVPIARTRSGTLALSTDQIGLIAEARGLDPANPTVQELASAMGRGDIDQMSFAFEAVDDPVVDGVRELREVKLFDVSIVTYPWYDATSVELNKDTYTVAEVRAMLADPTAPRPTATTAGMSVADARRLLSDTGAPPADRPNLVSALKLLGLNPEA